MRQMVRGWRHVFKLDPDRLIGDDALALLAGSGTDAFVVGGSTGITYENVSALHHRLRRYSLPLIQEVSHMEAVVPGFDGYLVPLVLNTRQVDWLIGQHATAIRQYGDALPWDRVLGEGYIVLNPESAVAKRTEAYEPEVETTVALAQLADRLLHLPIVYIEYSGLYGDMALVRRVRDQLCEARLFYGGGINDADIAKAALAVADTIVVGNAIYDDLSAALATVPEQQAIDNHGTGKGLTDERVSRV